MENEEWQGAPLTKKEKELCTQNAVYIKSLQEKRQTIIKAKEMGVGYPKISSKYR